jgi:hypothetical protein
VLRGGNGEILGGSSSESIEGEGSAQPGPGVSVQKSVADLLKKFSKARGQEHNNSEEVDDNFEWLNPLLTMDQVLASRDKYYR